MAVCTTPVEKEEPMATPWIGETQTLDDLERNPKAVVELAHRTKLPVILTSQGRPDVVVIDFSVFEERLKTVNLALLIAEAEADVRAGKVRPAEEFFAELPREKKVSR
jgi:prevent-host-death family protein